MSGNTHIMVDIETLGIHPSSPIIQVALTKFAPTGIVDTFDSYVYPQLTPPHIPDTSTIAWWFSQLKSNPNLDQPIKLDAPFIAPIIDAIRGWLGASTISGVWANDPDFDLAILNSHARTHDRPPLTYHSLHRSYRTLKSLIPSPIWQDFVNRYPIVTPHDARSDARAQSLRVIAAHHYLASKGVNVL